MDSIHQTFPLILSEWVISRCSLGLLGLIQIVLFSTHHLLRIFAHKRSVTVSELSDYITRRKKIKSQYLNEVQNGCTRSRIRIALCSGVRKKGLSVGYCEGLYPVKNQFVTAM